jgi:hypothetical protein
MDGERGREGGGYSPYRVWSLENRDASRPNYILHGGGDLHRPPPAGGLAPAAFCLSPGGGNVINSEVCLIPRQP